MPKRWNNIHFPGARRGAPYTVKCHKCGEYTNHFPRSTKNATLATGRTRFQKWEILCDACGHKWFSNHSTAFIAWIRWLERDGDKVVAYRGGQITYATGKEEKP